MNQFSSFSYWRETEILQIPREELVLLLNIHDEGMEEVEVEVEHLIDDVEVNKKYKKQVEKEIGKEIEKKVVKEKNLEDTCRSLGIWFRDNALSVALFHKRSDMQVQVRKEGELVLDYIQKYSPIFIKRTAVGRHLRMDLVIEKEEDASALHSFLSSLSLTLRFKDTGLII